MASYNYFGSVPSSSIFWKSLRRININSTLYMWKNFTVRQSSLGLLFAGSSSIIDSISLLVISYLNYLLLLDSVLVGWMFLETCPSLLGCPIYWHIIAHSTVMVFWISATLVVTSISFLILFIQVLSLFFLVRLARGLLILFYWFFLFFNLYLIYFRSDLYYFLPSAFFRFWLFFFF